MTAKYINVTHRERKCVCVCDEPVTLGLHVEKETVKTVFYKSPDKYSQGNQ